MQNNFTPVRGTNDYLPAVAALRENMRQKILAVYKKHGFMLVQTPCLENLEFLESSEGGENLRLIFKTIKRGEALNLTKKELTEADITAEGLRYDLTVPLVRFFCNNRENLPLPFKSIQCDYSFRAERPQKGRDRQFIQCDIDIIGNKSETAEIEVLNAGLAALDELGLNNLVLKISDRRILNSVILKAGFTPKDIGTVSISLDKADKLGLNGVAAELLSKQFSQTQIDALINIIKNFQAQGLDGAHNIAANEDICRLARIINIVSNINKNVAVKFDISIVRGQGYYTGTVYEVFSPKMRGAIAAGGRYDSMIGKLTGVEQAAVGFSIGFEPISIIAQELGLKHEAVKKVALIYNEDANFPAVINQQQKIMQSYDCITYKAPKNIKALLNKLKACGIDKYKFFEKEEIKDIN